MGRLATIVALSLTFNCAGAVSVAAAWPFGVSSSPSVALSDGIVLARGGMGGGGGMRCGPGCSGGGMGGLGGDMGDPGGGMGGIGSGMGGFGGGMGGGIGGGAGSNSFRGVPQPNCLGDRNQTDRQSLLCGDGP